MGRLSQHDAAAVRGLSPSWEKPQPPHNIPWGVAVGPDGAAYVAMAPEYQSAGYVPVRSIVAHTKCILNRFYTHRPSMGRGTAGRQLQRALCYVCLCKVRCLWTLVCTIHHSTQAGRQGTSRHQVIGLGVLRRPSGLCFDDGGRLYVAGLEGVARFCPDPANDNLLCFDRFLCRSVHAEGCPVEDGMVVLPAGASDVAYAGGMVVMSAHGTVGAGQNPHHAQGLWVLNAQTGALLKHIDTARRMSCPNYIALTLQHPKCIATLQHP